MLDALERKLEFFQIALFRSLAIKYLEMEKAWKERRKQERMEEEERKRKAAGDKSPRKGAAGGGGLWGMFGYFSSSAADDDPTPLPLTDDVWRAMYAAYQEEESHTDDENEEVFYLSLSLSLTHYFYL